MREDWVECKIGELFKVVTGNTPDKGNIEFYKSDDYPFYKPTDLNAGVNVSKSLDCFSKLGFSNSRSAPAKSILVTCIGATIGKAGLITNPGGFNQQINAILPNDVSHSKFIYYQIISTKFQKELIKNSSSTTLPIINKSRFNDLYFLLPPLPEQRAIVKKLENLFSSLDAGIADFKKAQQQLKIYRQAVLKKAFEGIKEEVSLEDVKADSLIGLVRSSSAQHATIGCPYIKMNNIDMDGKTDIENVVYVEASNFELGKYSLVKGDILINTRNSFELVGKSGIIKKDLENYTFNNNLMRLRLKPGMNPFFIFYQIIGPRMRKMMISEKKATTNICALYQRDIFPLKVKKLDRIEEQNQIVKQIEFRLSVCASIEKSIKESLIKAEALRQSILKKAFDGKLLTTPELAECKKAPDYEPASLLLERIKAEQRVAEPEKKVSYRHAKVSL